MRSTAHSVESQALPAESSGSGSAEGQPYALSGTNTHLFVAVPPAMVPQTLAYSFLHMDMLQHLALVAPRTQTLQSCFKLTSIYNL